MENADTIQAEFFAIRAILVMGDSDICKPCHSEIWSYVKFFLMILILLFYIIIQVKITLGGTKNSNSGIILRQLVSYLLLNNFLK